MAKILYAEDSAEYYEDFITYLKKNGHTVYHVTDGEDALEVYRQKKPDLALLDVMMLKMTGLEVARVIRKDDSVIPILFISSIGSSSAAVAGFKSGANDYIRKDMDEAEFKARIEAALRQIGFRERSEKTIDISDGVYLDLVNRELVVDGDVILFSPLEMKVMKVLCENKNCYVTKDILVQAGWSNTFKESYRYLDKCLVGLRKMLPKDGSISIATKWGKALGLMVKEK